MMDIKHIWNIYNSTMIYYVKKKIIINQLKDWIII